MTREAWSAVVIEDGTGRTMEVDSHGVIYIAEDGNKRVLAVSPDSSQVKTVAAGLRHPASVAVDARGTVYIADVGAGVIAVSPNGHRSTVGRNLDSTIALAVGPDGSLYAAGWPGGLTQIRPDGMQTARPDDASVASVTASLAVDSQGVAYLADGELLRRISPQGHSTVIRTELSTPQWVAVGADDTLYVAGKQQYASPNGPSLVVRITKDGRQTNVGVGPNLPLGLAADRQGAVYFIDGVSRHLLRVGYDGRTETVGPLAGGPTALAIDRQGSLYIADYTEYSDGAGRVGARAGGTRILKVMPDGRQTVILAGGLQYPRALVVDSAGLLYVLDGSNDATRVLRVPLGGGQPQVIPGLTQATGLTVDSRGILYGTEADVNDRTSYTPQLSLVKVYGDGHRETTKLHLPGIGVHPLAVDSHGALYCADWQRVLQIAGDGHQTFITSPLKGPIEALAVDSTGTLYLVGQEDGRVLALPRSGRPMAVGSGLYKPEGIGVDAHGVVYIADSGNRRIVKVTAAL